MDPADKSQEDLPKHKIIIKPPPEDVHETSSIGIFKSLKVPNLEKIILSSHDLYTDFLNFAGEIWNKNSEAAPVDPVSESSSHNDSSKIIILHKKSSIQGLSPSPKPKKIRSSKSFAPVTSKIPFLQIEEDVQPQVTSIMDYCKLQSESQIGHLSSIANLNSLEYNGKGSVIYKEISILPGFFDSINEVDDKVQESSEDNSKTEIKGLSDVLYQEKIIVEKHNKTQSVENYKGIPDLFEYKHRSEHYSCKKLKKVGKYALETAPDLPTSKKCSVDCEEEKNPEALLSNSVDKSLDQLFQLIPRSILYQIPILTFEEFINSLMNDEIKTEKGVLWTINSLRRLINKCCCNSLPEEDFKVCERIIAFDMTRFNFQNSLHLILLLSCFKSVHKTDRWPHKDDDWYEMGFNTNNIEKELMHSGTISLLNIFFLSSYFPAFYLEMLKVRRYYSFDLYEIIASISEITLTILRKNKLSKLIKANGRALEVIFFFFAGVMLFWFRELVKCTDYLKIYDVTVKKATSCMNELLKEAWRVYLESKSM